MPNPILAPEYWVDATIEAIAQMLEAWASNHLSAETNRHLRATAKDLRDNRLEIIASVTEPEGG